MTRFIIAILIVILLSACMNDRQHSLPSEPSVTIKLLPLGEIENKYILAIYKQLQATHIKVDLLPAEKLPSSAWYEPRTRYRADFIIQWLQKRSTGNEVYLAITNVDISTTKGTIKDWGVMGLGYCPGRACIASTFRLKDKSNFYKVAIHELAHTTGLPHCADKSCYLRDAKGGDPTKEETGFCEKCANHLTKKGWKT